MDGDDAFDGDVEEWLRSEVVMADDAVKVDPSRAIPMETVKAELKAKWAARS